MPAGHVFDQMLLMDAQTLLTLLVVAGGSGVFLRLVAKEKHRREKHLAFRLLEEVKELEEEARRKQLYEEVRHSSEEEEEEEEEEDGGDSENGESGD